MQANNSFSPNGILINFTLLITGHPFFIIVSVILGNTIWGIVGMIIAISVFAIFSVVSRNIPALEPFGYLFSSDK